MDLWQEIFCDILRKYSAEIAFLQAPSLKELFSLRCYQALRKIQDILKDDSLSDKECFAKIEEIVCVFEELGSDCGERHDFG